MTGYQLQKWERTKELAKLCNVTWQLRKDIAFFTVKGLSLGSFETVDEAFAFMCGYEHYASEISSVKICK
jgi:hypothetical protein